MISQDSKIVGENIKSLREKMNLTQEALAHYLNTPRENISYYETGARSIPSSQLSKLANLFCMSEYDFYEENIENKEINIAFAFRAAELKPKDLESIAQFKKIVRNYMNMQKVLGDE
jgi:transcriptional regulator with XRE-family HTH domain